MDFADSILKKNPDTGRSTGSYIIFYQGGTIDHVTHVLVPVAQSSAESVDNAACATWMASAHFRMLIHEYLNKGPFIVLEEAPLMVLASNSVMSMAKNGKDTKHTRHISRRIHLVRNGESLICTRLTGVREVCNWQTLLPIILVSMI